MKNVAVVNIHPGSRDVETLDWCGMLLRMYLRWSERRGFKAEAPIDGLSFTIEGENV